MVAVYEKEPVPSLCSMSLSEHTFLVTNLLSGQVVSEVDLGSFNFNEILNRPGGGSATARIDAPTTTEDNFLAWGNALWCLEGDDILWGGIIGAVQPRASSSVLNIPLHGFMEYYRTQPIQTTVPPVYTVTFPPNAQWEYGLSYGGHPHGSAVVFGQKDQFQIFEDLIYHIERRDSLSNIHPKVRYDQLSGVLRDETWYNYEYKMVGTTCEQLADRENGFFWSTKFEFDADSPSFIFYLNHNLLGIDREIIFEWDDRPEPTILTEYDFGGYQKPASSVIALGEGQGPAALVARKESPTDTLGTHTGLRPRYYEVRTMPDIKVQATLQSHANKYWDRHKVPYRSGTVSMMNPDSSYMSFELGDTVSIRIDHNELHILDRYRVVSKDVVLTPEGDKEVSLSLEEPFAIFEET